jgi:hypothetical protein
MTKYQEKNERMIETLLEEGETIEWRGVTEPYHVFSDESKKSLFIRWGICIAGIVLWAIYCIVFHDIEGANSFALVLSMILVVLFFAYLSYMPFQDKKKIVGKNSYYLTNRRAIYLDGSDHSFVMNLYGVKADFLAAEDGNLTLLLRNSADRKIPKTIRMIAWRPIRDDYAGGIVTDMVFYNVKKDAALTKPFH